MNTSTRIAADILIAAIAATQNRITAIDEKQARELAEAFKVIHATVAACGEAPDDKTS